MFVAIAARRGVTIDPRLFIDAQSESPRASETPVAGLTVLTFPNNHLAYALTWFRPRRAVRRRGNRGMAQAIMTRSLAQLSYPPASARNMALLVQLRWMAVAGQLLTIWIAAAAMGVNLPLPQLITVPVLLGFVNLATSVMGREREGYSYMELLGALMLDVAALGWQLYFSGGTTNPFTFLFLLQIVIGAILLPPDWSWIVAAIAALGVALLTFLYRPLALPPQYAAEPLRLYLLGSLLCFLLIAALLVFFVIRMDRNRRQSDAALATLRQAGGRGASHRPHGSACFGCGARTGHANVHDVGDPGGLGAPPRRQGHA